MARAAASRRFGWYSILTDRFVGRGHAAALQRTPVGLQVQPLNRHPLVQPAVV